MTGRLLLAVVTGLMALQGAGAAQQGASGACRSLEKSDAALNAAYSKALAKLGDDSAAVNKLTVAQRNWLKFRDAHVESVFPADDKRAEYGSAFQDCSCAIVLELTQTRLHQLEAWSVGIPEGDVCIGSRPVKN
ncbi:lysozyme inhibitor LprI family protein [Blastochloris viridis]|uniref:Putative periplasmic protein n=1 Tax=Blastochloris viridis TaxID=1079 RepID=A0A0H5BAJ1_BLAVI|nr:lysozyme inhibitor LprI family protein [Blastochloris viridis]ALK08643.1 hypothetical protein BVIR_850 [Blastochloris viridis]BAR98064.1 putative periplasmic protein [Blastochloris viridis]CUU41306.1 hypothetical protein BVIRIDIS_02950 [Blastochloris viridis]